MVNTCNLKQLIKNRLPVHTIGNLLSIRTYLIRIFSERGTKRIKCPFPIRELSTKKFHIYFGYYDLSPFSRDEKFVLAIAAPLKNRSPHPHSQVLVGHFLLNESDDVPFKVLGSSTTWCWQQGCRLQWYPSTSWTTILYNRIVEGRYGAVIQDILTGEVVRTYNRPIYAISRNGSWGLSLNFSRLQRLRPGYGYNTFADTTLVDRAPSEDGIWLINMKSGESRLILSLEEIAQGVRQEEKAPDGAEHYFNHLCFNPRGDRFVFFHIWKEENKRIIRMMTADRNGKNLYSLESSGMVSHFNWISDTELIVFARSTSGLGYYIYRDQMPEKKIIALDLLKEDGHPSYSPDGRFLLTDTYPDRFGNQRLLLLENSTHRMTELGSFFRPHQFRGETRCDLHPRWSPSGRYVAFDSAHSGKRSLCVLDLSEFSVNPAKSPTFHG